MDKIQDLRTKLPRRERRLITGATQLRAATDGGGPKIGMRIPFGKRSLDMGFTEIIDPGAFTKTLQESRSDVVALWNHMPEWVLGRQSNRMLQIEIGPDAMDGTVTLDPANRMHMDCFAPNVARGDVIGSSFGFETVRDDWLTEADGSITRTLLEVRLYDLSPVTFPAYPDSEAESRAVREARAATVAAAHGIDPVEFIRVMASIEGGQVEARHAESVRRWVGVLQGLLPTEAAPAEGLERKRALRRAALDRVAGRHGIAAA